MVPRPVTAKATPPILEGVELVGCGAVLRDGACELPEEGGLHIWVPGDTHDLRIALAGVTLEPDAVHEFPGGARYDLAPKPDARELVVRRGAASATFALRSPRPVEETIKRARARRADGDLDAALALLAPAEQSADGRDRATALGLEARIARGRGEDDAADALYERAIVAGEEAGVDSQPAEDSFAFAFSLRARGRLGDARRVLAHAAELSLAYAEGRLRGTYYQAWLASDTGRRRDALGGFRDVSAHAERLGMDRLRRMARTLAGAQLDAIGRSDEALADLRAMLEAEKGDMIACDRAELASNIGWVALHAAHVDAREPLLLAIDLYRECKVRYDVAAVANVLGDLARAELDRGRPREARARLAEAEKQAPHPPLAVALEWLAIEGDIALAENRVDEARRLFDELAAAAAGVDDRDRQRVALEGRAEALARQNDPQGAIAALASAADLLDIESVEVPLGEGRESFVALRARGDLRRMALLVSLGRDAQALVEVRRAGARVLASLESARHLAALDETARARWDEAVGAYRRERDAVDREAAGDWKLSSVSLATRRAERGRRAQEARGALEAALARAAPRPSRIARAKAPGELTLAYIAEGAEWTAFAATEGSVRAVRLGGVDVTAPAAVIATRLFAPFASEIAQATRIAVIGRGDARAVDVHALPFEGAPLYAHAPVVYPLDATLAEEPVTSGPALLVADPTSDLRGARAEVDAVEGALRDAGGWELRILVGARATGEAVRTGLSQASLFHYAGHGVSAGRDGWESVLPLAAHGQLTVGDVLALPRAPATAILLGCETTRAEGFGLAQAFVVAGSRAVVAVTREVDDTTAAAIARALYAAEPAKDAGEALRRAQLDARARGLGDVEAFRVLVP